MIKNCLAYIKGLSSSLQAHCKDICQAFNEINSVTSALQKVRTQVNSYHACWYREAISMAELSQEPSMPCISGRQQNRCNVSADTPEVN